MFLSNVRMALPSLRFTMTLMLGAVLCNAVVLAMPYRSTQGVLHTRPSLNDFLTSYLQAATQQQQRAAEPQYGYPEFQPPYQQGYIAHRPRRVQQQNLGPLIQQYLNNPELLQQQQDYANYDLSGADALYNDADGTWYDDGTVIGSPSYAPRGSAPSADFLSNEPTEQDLALAQLMLDHIAGKYSLEDLETLEREARLEENTENQLRALTKKVHRKKSLVMPYSGPAPSRSAIQSGPRSLTLSRATPRLAANSRGTAPQELLTLTQRRGQKEEPVMVPATSVRRPVFVQQIEQHTPLDDGISETQSIGEKKSSKPSTDASDSAIVSSTSSTFSQSSKSPSAEDVASSLKSDASKSSSTSLYLIKAPDGSRPRTSGVVEVVRAGHPDSLPPSPESKVASNSSSKDANATADKSSSGVPSTMAPYVQSAYEALKKYLDTERQARINADQEYFQAPQKRFVRPDDDPLPRELNNLKKTVV